MTERIVAALVILLCWAGLCFGFYVVVVRSALACIAAVRALQRRRGIAPSARDSWQPTPPGVGEWTSFSLDPKRGIEETRLMPGAEQDETDQVAEGLGCVRPPRCHRAHPSRATWYCDLPADEQELWADAVRASFRARP